MKITFLTRALKYGGAETQLVVLAKGLCDLGHSVKVIVFYPGPLERELIQAGVPVHCLNKRGRWELFAFLFQLIIAIREEKPDVLHGYLVLPNVLTILLKMISPRMRTVLGVRASTIDYANYDWLGRFLILTERFLSRFADLIIVNSHAGLEYAKTKGFPQDRMLVIPNGIDTGRFRPNPQEGREQRKRLGLDVNSKVIGLVARMDPLKDHPTFITAAASLAKRRKDVRFLCVGNGPEIYRQQLMKLCKDLGILQSFKFIDPVSNMVSIYNAMDLLVSSSYGEGFSNVIAEAMACNVPCVVTEVGDSKWIVGDKDRVVPPQNPEALQEAIERLLSLGSKTDGNKSTRHRISINFSVSTLVRTTEAALINVVTAVKN